MLPLSVSSSSGISEPAVSYINKKLDIGVHLTYLEKEGSVSGLDKDKDEHVFVVSPHFNQELSDLIIAELFHPTNLEVRMPVLIRGLQSDGRTVTRKVEKDGSISKTQNVPKKS